MPIIELADVTLHYQTHGHGDPLLLIHGGWGLGVNGFGYQTRTLADTFQLIVPDRRGYGRSTRTYSFGADFHWQHADDLLRLLDRLPLTRVHVWGHSDGAIIGAIMAIVAPQRVRSLAFEGGHLYCRKPYSTYPMDQIALDPTLIPAAAQRRLADYHGADYWPQVIRNWASGWVALHDRVDEDLYQGRLSEITCPSLILHGAHDEHTPVWEIEQLAARLSTARLMIYPNGGHSLHDDRGARAACTQAVRALAHEAP